MTKPIYAKVPLHPVGAASAAKKMMASAKPNSRLKPLLQRMAIEGENGDIGNHHHGCIIDTSFLC